MRYFKIPVIIMLAVCLLSGCAKGDTAKVSSTVAEQTKMETNEVEADDDSAYFYGGGYKFNLPTDWIYVSPSEGYDLEMIYNSLDSKCKYGVINMKISSCSLEEKGCSIDDRGLRYYGLDQGNMVIINGIWGSSVEQVSFLEEAQINGNSAYKSVYTSLYNIISFDLEKIPKDEKGYYIMNDMSEYATVTHPEVPCALTQCFIRNEGLAIKIEFIMPNDDAAILEDIVYNVLSGFKLC